MSAAEHEHSTRPAAVGDGWLDTIGDTPVVELRHVADDAKGRLFVKVETRNPTGSKDDRVARRALADARAEGRLERCQTVVAVVDGSMGLALAQAAAVMRHPFIAVVDRAVGERHLEAMRSLGAQVVVEEGAPGRCAEWTCRVASARLYEEARKIVEVTGAVDLELVRNRSAFRAHRLETAQEIVRQVGGHFGVFADCVASGALLSACAAAFHELDPGIRSYAVEIASQASLACNAPRASRAAVPLRSDVGRLPLLTPDRLAGVVRVSLAEARRACAELARKEGILAGLRTGATLAAASRLADGEAFGETIVIVLHPPDTAGTAAIDYDAYERELERRPSLATRAEAPAADAA